MGYIKENLIAIDQLAHTLVNGRADETLSSHAWRSREHKYWGWTYKAINALFFWEPDHCRLAYEREVERGHTPREIREARLVKQPDGSLRTED